MLVLLIVNLMMILVDTLYRLPVTAEFVAASACVETATGIPQTKFLCP